MRTFFTSLTAVEGEDDSAKMIRSAAQLRGMQALDVWVPDNEDATAPSMRDEGADDIVDSMEEFEATKESGMGAISMTQTTIVIDGIQIDIEKDRMWDEATYQAAMTPIALFQDVYENRLDQHDDLIELYSEDIVERAKEVGG